ncbi:hypothetical protein Poli38472_005136 [Pythium oligandrum]|uniref:Transmembrane protein n=1 Tax=Pythium oligandrum TaxID=41045 RepID=A0A8K1FLB8_PYTOL|nr:hypothetical protein Poli38472_005136 [Pythium oligandrum]|eukprot:TMW62518.1 hypothetical protein Poli38472_005136 [Pythium oligandrum]
MVQKATKTRSVRAADAASADLQRHSLPHTQLPLATKTTGWVILKKSTRGVLAAFMASARPLAVLSVVAGLFWLAVKIVGRFQLWMTAAGVLMVVLSVASAVQEVMVKQVAPSSVEYLDEECSKIAIATSDKTAEEIPVVMDVPQTHAVAASDDVALNMASPALVDMTKQQQPTNETSVKPARRNSSTLELGDNKLLVVHCGTVINVQGSRGFIIPHNLPSKPSPKAATRTAYSPSPLSKLPLVIPFELSAVLAALRPEVTVGKTVEFSCAEDETTSRETVVAVNVRPVATDEGIVKSRNALQTCKQAREASFAKAMGAIKRITPRNVPVKHPVDLIKVAEHLDDQESPIDHFI